jgi:hypothetical protein
MLEEIQQLVRNRTEIASLLFSQSPELVAPFGCRNRAMGRAHNDVCSSASGFGLWRYQSKDY